MSARSRIALATVTRIIAVSVVIGAIYGHSVALAHGGHGFEGILHGALTGAIISSILGSFELFALDNPWGQALRRLPLLPHLTVKSAVYLVVILFGLAAGEWVMPEAGDPRTGVLIHREDVFFSVVVSLIINFILDMNSLLGQGVLLSFITGRYHRPRVEERVLLFIDMEGSTQIAERLGEVAFHRLLNRFVVDLTGPIVDQYGEVHKYVGDELIVTWKLADGCRNARCVRACFDALEKLAGLGPVYERQFGVRPNFRASLHCGPVVTGEMGSIKREIALIGDTMNTAARIVDACRESGERVIASAALLDQLDLPAGIASRPLGPIRLRGRQSAISLCGLVRAKPEAVRSPAA